MRGSDQQNGSLFSYVNLEERVPARHPLRTIKAVVDPALASLDADFNGLYSGEGRPSIAPSFWPTSRISQTSPPIRRYFGATPCILTARKSCRSFVVTSTSTSPPPLRQRIASLPDALHYQHVHAARSRGPASANPRIKPQPRIRELVRGNP